MGAKKLDADEYDDSNLKIVPKDANRNKNRWSAVGIFLLAFVIGTLICSYITETKTHTKQKKGIVNWGNPDDIPCNPSNLDVDVWREVTKRKMKYYGGRRIFYNVKNGRYVAYDRGIINPQHINKYNQPSHWHLLNRGKYKVIKGNDVKKYLTPDGIPTNSHHIWTNCK